MPPAKAMCPPFKIRFKANYSYGFTLLELLVVITITAILIAMVSFAVPDIRSRAKTIQCVQNLRIAGSALNLYGNDHNSIKRAGVIYSFLGGSVPGEDAWSNRLVENGYITNRAALRCPAVSKPATATSAANWFYEVYGMNMATQQGISIGENVSRGGYNGGVFSLPLSRITEPSRFILLADSRSPNLSASGGEVQRFRLLKDGNSRCDAVALRHDNKANIYFLDGHIESLGEKELRALQNTPYAALPFYRQDGAFFPQ